MPEIIFFSSHNGVIYVIGGDDGTSNLSSVEMYNPKVKFDSQGPKFDFFLLETFSIRLTLGTFWPQT